MKRLLYILALSGALCASAPSCGSSNSDAEAARIDSLRADSIVRAQNAARRADSISRERRIDSIQRHTHSADLTFFGLHGTVEHVEYMKSCEWVGSPRPGTILDFDSTGRLSPDTLMRDANGHIRVLGDKAYAWGAGKPVFVGPSRFGSDEDEYRRLDRTFLKHTYSPDSGHITGSVVYNNMPDIIVRYSYQITDTDRFGNWTARNVIRIETLTEDQRQLSSETIPERRTITYRQRL
ncbi:MAG: hypothetical protein NC043_02900 [Muribaculaceae bacterium]|nr:hypothetical protein [Muribaculaceae bacterium]